MTSQLVSYVVHSGRATLAELRSIYTLEDLYRLWEIDYIPQYNEWYDAERRREKDRLNQLAKTMRL